MAKHLWIPGLLLMAVACGPSLYQRAIAVPPVPPTNARVERWSQDQAAAMERLVGEACAAAHVTCLPYRADAKPGPATVAAAAALATSIKNPSGPCFVMDTFPDGLTDIRCPAFESPYGVTFVPRRCVDPAYPIPVYLPKKEHPDPVACGAAK